MISILIPAYNEQLYLNKTIDNFISTAEGDVEVIVVLNGYDQEVDERAVVIRSPENIGERKAMNAAARIAKGEYLMRIDAHCDMSEGWDTKMIEVLDKYPRGIAVSVLVGRDKNWKPEPGWYAFCKLLPTMEEKWTSKKEYGVIEPNMAFTGCGWVISKDFYWSFGGADETLPIMGAIGPEFALRAWLEGDGVYTRTDVVCGHIWNTGGYNTSDVVQVRKKLTEKWGSRYGEIMKKFPEHNEKPGTKTAKEHRTIVVERKDEHVTTDNATGKPIKKVIEVFKYVFEDDGTGPSETEISKKYGPKAKKVSEELYYPNDVGEWIKVA